MSLTRMTYFTSKQNQNSMEIALENHQNLKWYYQFNFESKTYEIFMSLQANLIFLKGS